MAKNKNRDIKRIKASGSPEPGTDLANNDAELYRRRYERERLARKLAEQIAEDISRELYIKGAKGDGRKWHVASNHQQY
jgi:hypothetical protein